MIVTSDVASGFDHRLERMVPARIRLVAKSIPSRDAVKAGPLGADGLFEKFKSRAQPSPEFILRNGGQLRLRIVDVINVHAIEIQIAQRLLQLVVEISGRHAVRSAGNVSPRRDACVDEVLFDVTAHVAGRRAIKWQVTTLSANNYFFASKSALLNF